MQDILHETLEEFIKRRGGEERVCRNTYIKINYYNILLDNNVRFIAEPFDNNINIKITNFKHDLKSSYLMTFREIYRCKYKREIIILQNEYHNCDDLHYNNQYKFIDDDSWILQTVFNGDFYITKYTNKEINTYNIKTTDILTKIKLKEEFEKYCIEQI